MTSPPRCGCPASRSRSRGALADADTATLERRAFRAVADDGSRAGMACLLGLYLGMRRAEIAPAQWTGFDGAPFPWQRVKTGDIAELPCHPRLRDALDVYTSVSPYLFVGRQGQSHVSTNTILALDP